MSPNFKAFLTLVVLLSCFILASKGRAEVVVTPYASFGIGHRDCAITDRALCKNDKSGSDTPGFIEAGFNIKPMLPTAFLLWSDEVDIGWRHQSYVDRGWLIPGVLDFGGEEYHIDSYAINFIYKFDSLSFRF